MILSQGWKNNKVHVIVISLCQNGMNGWTVYLGVYDPNRGGTYETAEWTCLNSSQNLVDLLYYSVFSEMATWVGGGPGLKNLQDVLLVIHEQMKQVAGYIQTAAQHQQLVLHDPVAIPRLPA
jgi:hypothetical protein